MKKFYPFLCFILILLLVLILSIVNSHFYPIKYKNEIAIVSAESGVDKALIYSIINTESGFDKNAKSSKGAIGLMQILPSTAMWISEKNGESFAEENLFEPKTNILLGAWYLKYLFENFSNLKEVLCAYNAGPQNVKNWLSDTRYSTNGKTLNKIPFEETRQYVNKVQKNYHYYKNRVK